MLTTYKAGKLIILWSHHIDSIENLDSIFKEIKGLTVNDCQRIVSQTFSNDCQLNILKELAVRDCQRTVSQMLSKNCHLNIVKGLLVRDYQRTL